MKKKWNLFLSDHYTDGYGTGLTGPGFSSGGGTGYPSGVFSVGDATGCGTGSYFEGGGVGAGRDPSHIGMSEWLVVERS